MNKDIDVKTSSAPFFLVFLALSLCSSGVLPLPASTIETPPTEAFTQSRLEYKLGVEAYRDLDEKVGGLVHAERALEHFQKALELDPGYRVAGFYIGSLGQTCNKPNLTYEMIAKFFQDVGGDLSAALKPTGDRLFKAIPDPEKSLQLNSEGLAAYRIYKSSPHPVDLARAETLFRQAAGYDRTNFAALTNLACALSLQEKWEEASNILGFAYQLNPEQTLFKIVTDDDFATLREEIEFRVSPVMYDAANRYLELYDGYFFPGGWSNPEKSTFHRLMSYDATVRAREQDVSRQFIQKGKKMMSEKFVASNLFDSNRTYGNLGNSPAAQAIGALGPDAAENLPLLEKLLAVDGFLDSHNALLAIGKIMPIPKKKIAKSAQSPKREMRLSALGSIRNLPLSDRITFVPVLTFLLGDADENVRLAAVFALYSCGEKAAPATGELVKLLQTGDRRLKIFAARTLAIVGQEKSAYQVIEFELQRFDKWASESFIYPKDRLARENEVRDWEGYREKLVDALIASDSKTFAEKLLEEYVKSGKKPADLNRVIGKSSIDAAGRVWEWLGPQVKENPCTSKKKILDWVGTKEIEALAVPVLVSLLDDTRRFEFDYGFVEASFCAAEVLGKIGSSAESPVKLALKDKKLSEPTRALLEKEFGNRKPKKEDGR